MTTNPITLTADIVAAYVSNNTTSAKDVPGLIRSIHDALANIGTIEPPAEKPTPAVPIKASVKPGHLVCLCCGFKGKMLKRHLWTEHRLQPDDYRTLFDLPAAYPMVAADYAARRREIAKTNGLGCKPGQRVVRRKVA